MCLALGAPIPCYPPRVALVKRNATYDDLCARGRTMRVYASERVGHLWIVDPILRTLEVYRLENGRWVVASTHGGTEQVSAEPFEALALDMRRWWREQ